MRIVALVGATIPDGWRADPRFEVLEVPLLELERALAEPCELVLVPSQSADLVRRIRMRARTTVLTTDGHDPGAKETVDLSPEHDPIHAEAQQRKSELVLGMAQLAAGVAHEVNNPAAYVAANLQVLREVVDAVSILALAPQPPKVELERLLGEAREIISENLQGMSRISSIVRNLMDFSQLDQDRVEAVQINEVVNAACSIVYNQVRHRARLIKALGDVPVIAADRGRLTQVMVNLLMNSAEAIEEGAAGHHFVEIRTELAGDQIVISVIDSGPGIPKEVQHLVFEPFFTTKSGPKNVGLGLPVCVDIVRHHRGDLRMVTQVDRGTRFDVLLPLHTGLAAEVPLRAKPVDEDKAEVPRGARVLLIDDETLLLKAYRRMLADSCEVVTAAGGEEALELLRYDPNFDAVICDLMMPHVDGPMIYEELARTAPDLIPRIIFCSGGAFTPRARTFAGTVANQLLEKPVGANALKAAIARITKKAAQSRTTAGLLDS